MGNSRVNGESTINCVALRYILLLCVLWQEGEIYGSGRVMFGEELQTANGMYDVLMSFIFFFLLSVSAHLYHSFNVTFTFSFEILYIHDALILTSRVVNGL